MASPSYIVTHLARSPKFVPGTGVEYIRRHGDFGFLIEQSYPINNELLTLGYGFPLVSATRRKAPDGFMWITAQSQTEASPVVIDPDEQHHREYNNPAIAACIEEEITRINAEFERDREKLARKLAKNPRPIVVEAPAPIIVAEPKRSKSWTEDVHPNMKAGSAEWKRLVRQLYRQKTGTPARSITREVVATLQDAGLLPSKAA